MAKIVIYVRRVAFVVGIFVVGKSAAYLLLEDL
jgi:hypothetical protein